MALPGTEEKPHFDRLAYRVCRIYATLASDDRTANLKFSPDEQLLKCEVAPDLCSPSTMHGADRAGPCSVSARLRKQTSRRR